MSDFDHIKSLLAPQCPQLTKSELDDLTMDIFVSVALPEMAPKAMGLFKTRQRPTPPPCEQLCQ